MKKKLTITIDEDLLPEAKAYARSQGASLSCVVEEALRELTIKNAEPFSKRWRGKLELDHKDTPRFKTLAERLA